MSPDESEEPRGRDALASLFEEAGHVGDAPEPTAATPAVVDDAGVGAPTAPTRRVVKKVVRRAVPRPQVDVDEAAGEADDVGVDGDDDDDEGQPDRARPFRRKPRRKLRARKVDRILRRIDPWAVLKVSLLFYFCLWVIFLMAGVLLWSAAVGSGAIDNVENFVKDLFALETFEFNGDQIFRGSALGGLVLVVVGTGFNVLASVLFNLISDLTGGVRVSVIELENLRRAPERQRRRPA